MSRYQKGAGFERALVNKFWETGFAAVRVAGSGSAPHALPDIVAMRDGRVIAIECKATAKSPYYLGEEAVKKLKSFSDLSGAEAYVAVKFNNVKPMFIPLGLIKNRRITNKDPFVSFETLVGMQKTL